MKFLRFVVRRPVLVLMIFGALVLFGAYSLTQLPVDQFPKIEPPVITVVTAYPASGAEDVEKKVTNPLERTFTSLPGLSSMQSISKENLSLITLTMERGTDLEATVNGIRQRLDFVKKDLPADAMNPWIFKFSTSMLPVMIIGVKADKGELRAYRKLIKEKLVPSLERVPGVGSCMMLNAPRRRVLVEVNRKRLQDRDLSLFRLIRTLQAQNMSVPAGRMVSGQLDLPISVPGDFQNLDQIRNTLVAMSSARPLAGASRAGIPDPFYLALGQVYLKDVATVKMTTEDRQAMARFGSAEAMWIMVFRRSGANTVEVVDRINKRLPHLQKQLPAELTVVTILDGSEFIRATVDNLTSTVIVGGILVLVVILLFLRKLRPSLVVALTIPTSIVAVFMGMYFMGYTLNSISLMAMALAVGMVVDAAIVVLEAITRRVEEGEPPHEAAVTGTAEVAGAVVASTLTTVVIFAPLLFIRGFIGVMLGELAFVMIFTLCASLVTALVLTPALAARLIKPDAPDRRGWLARLGRTVEGGFHRLERGYGWLLGKSLRWRFVVVIVALAILGGSTVLAMRTGVDFVLDDDYGFIQITVELPEGTKLGRTTVAADDIAARLRSYPEVITTFYAAGTSEAAVLSTSGGKEGSNVFNLYTRLLPKDQRSASEDDVVERIRPYIKKRFPEAVLRFKTGNPMSQAIQGAEKPITINIKGRDFVDLKRAARQVEAALKTVDGTKDVAAELLKTKPDYRVVVDRKRAARMGLSSYAIGGTLRAAVHGWKATEYRGDDTPMDLVVRLRPEDRDTPQDLERLLIPNLAQKHVGFGGKTVHGGFMKFPLGNFARIVRGQSPIEIRHMDKERVVRVGASYRGRALGDVVRDADAALAKLQLPKGVTLEHGSEVKRQKEALADLKLVLLFSLLLVYMVMAAQFESLLDPLVIMFSVPFALTGVFLTFLVTGTRLSIPAFTGLIVLVGVVVNNAIVLIDYINQLRDEGMERNEAIRAAGERRLRPVLMTAFTTIMGMLPLALTTKEGAFIWAPMGQAVVGGLLVSTLITLIVIPVVYSLLEFARRRHKRAAWMKEAPNQPAGDPGGKPAPSAPEAA